MKLNYLNQTFILLLLQELLLSLKLRPLVNAERKLAYQLLHCIRLIVRDKSGIGFSNSGFAERVLKGSQ